jgi:POT family proton-dependent oligopeptide transporter
LSPLITPVIEQRLGFTGAFALPAFVFLVAFAVLFLGKDRYKSFPPEGSIMTKAVRYLWLIMTSKGSFARAKEYVNSCHAAGQTPPWDDDFAADLHLTLQACKIFCFYPMYWLVFAQSMTSLISQAATMETHGIPNDLLVVLNPIAILVLGPTFEFFVYPALHRIGIQFQPITRIACGFIFIGLSMAYAAALQYAIYASPPCYSYPLSLDCEDGKVPNQIHVLVQAPIYVLGAIGEIFGVATGYEYAFKQAPPTMRSLVMAVFLSTAAVALALGMIIAPFFTDPTLVWGYSGLSVAAFFTGAMFWKIFGGKVRSK